MHKQDVPQMAEDIVCQYYRITPEELWQRRRTKPLPEARAAVWWACRMYGGFTWTQIGGLFIDRTPEKKPYDHSTVIFMATEKPIPRTIKARLEMAFVSLKKHALSPIRDEREAVEAREKRNVSRETLYFRRKRSQFYRRIPVWQLRGSHLVHTLRWKLEYVANSP